MNPFWTTFLVGVFSLCPLQPGTKFSAYICFGSFDSHMNEKKLYGAVLLHATLSLVNVKW